MLWRRRFRDRRFEDVAAVEETHCESSSAVRRQCCGIIDAMLFMGEFIRQDLSA